MIFRLILLVAIAILTAAVRPLLAQEPQTREEAARREREAKSRTLTPPEISGLERLLLKLENGRILERLLSPPEGFYPRIGHVTPGSGLSAGPAYRRTGLFGEWAEFSASAMGSLKKYWLVEARLAAPELAGGAAFADIYVYRFDFPQEAFFGIGPSAQRLFESRYNLSNTAAGASGGVRLSAWLSLAGLVERQTPHVERGSGPGGAVHDRFNPVQIAGLLDQPDFNRYEVLADLNYRQPRGNPRSGGRYLVSYSMWDDRDLDRYNFRRFNVDLQQYIPMFQQRRVIALRAMTSMSDADAGQQVPFYLQRTLGGPDDLRGFRQYRFRDRNLLLLQAEYRWEVFTAMDAAIFYDAGKVTATRDDLNLRDLERDYGIGVRFGSANGVFLRVEGAFGSRDGKHLVLRFGNVF
jgi:Omp85 superfamily domain